MLSETSPYLTLPKVELHLHIDCSVTWASIQRLNPELPLATFLDRFVAPEKCTSLKQYLDAIAPSCAVLQSSEALRIVTEELIGELARDGVIYAELRFAPQTHLSGGLNMDQVLEAVTEGMRLGCESNDIEIGLILCALRDFPANINIEVIELASRWHDRGVVGVDIAGNEAGEPLSPNYRTFARAHELGLSVTAHAGEALGPESVFEILEHLEPSRIGHGIRSIEDDSLIGILKERDIHLEVCPSSNVQVGVFPSYDQHPVDALSRRGVSLGINTDARTVAPISLSLEYDRLEQHFGWGKGEFLAHNLEAARHAFQPEPVREALCARLISDWAAP